MINIQDPQVKQVAPGLVYAILFKAYDDFTANQKIYKDLLFDVIKNGCDWDD